MYALFVAMFPGRGSYGAPVESWLSTHVSAPRPHASIQFHDFRRAGNRDLGLPAISSPSVAFRQRFVWIGLDEKGGNAHCPPP
jgi:hypothetical protein